MLIKKQNSLSDHRNCSATPARDNGLQKENHSRSTWICGEFGVLSVLRVIGSVFHHGDRRGIMSRFLIAFLAVAFVFAFAPQSMAQFSLGQQGQGSSGTPKGQRAVNLNASRSNIYRKANPDKKSTAQRATTVKSSKSNTSDRMGGGGGGGPWR